MTVLVDWQIRELCENGLVEPFDESLINPSSLDVRLGNSIMIETTHGLRECDISERDADNPYMLSPNEFILASTLEYLNFPRVIAGKLKLKSSRAREGLTHSLAGWIDNGFHGVLTLELKNYLCFNPVRIYPGLRIGQIVFYGTLVPDKSYCGGRYTGHKKVIPSLDSGNRTGGG